MRYEYDTMLRVMPEGGAYVAFPWDIRQEFGAGRVKVHAEFDGIPYAAFLPTLEDPDFTFVEEEELPYGYRPGDIVL